MKRANRQPTGLSADLGVLGVTRVIPRVVPIVALLLGIWGSSPAAAHHLLPSHELRCSADFPCPQAIQPRVNFWIGVFHHWSAEDAIFHDANYPDRVFAVVNTGHGCNKPASRSAVRHTRNQLEREIKKIATKRSRDGRFNADEIHLAMLFGTETANQIRATTQRIRCQTGGKESFQIGLQRFQGYERMIAKILREHQLPEDIRFLPFVESSFNPIARSRVGAAGIWQIMPHTGRILGLKRNTTVDERLDPELATRAAAKYLVNAERKLMDTASNKDRLASRRQINPFVITSYNYGVSGMRRAIDKVSPDFMEVLQSYRSRRFRVAVQNFYASFLAASHLARNHAKYYGKPKIHPHSVYHTVRMKHETSIARIKSVFELSEKQLRPYNHSLSYRVWKGNRAIPAGYPLRLPQRSHNWESQRAKLAALPREKFRPRGNEYIVAYGDTPCEISEMFQIGCSVLMRANRIGRRDYIYAGQKLFIPGGKPRQSRPRATPVSSTSAASVYVVRRGDTPCEIALRFRVRCSHLMRVNRINKRGYIRVGKKLWIPRTRHNNPTPQRFAPQRLVAMHNPPNFYVVRRGDTACGIALRFRLNCNSLLRENRLNIRSILYPGQKLAVRKTN